MSSEVAPHSKIPIKFISEGAGPGGMTTIIDSPLKFCATIRTAGQCKDHQLGNLGSEKPG